MYGIFSSYWLAQISLECVRRAHKRVQSHPQKKVRWMAMGFKKI